MKPSTAWILSVIATCGVAYWLVTRDRLHYPPPDVAALELTRGDAAASDTCFSVDAVLRANDLTHHIWTSRAKGEWSMRIEPGGSSWRVYNFHVENGRLVPDNVVASDDLPDLAIEPAIDAWIARVHTPPMPGCRPPAS